MTPNPPTIREHAEWIAKWAVQHKVHEHAQAILDALDAAPINWPANPVPFIGRLVPDPAEEA